MVGGQLGIMLNTHVECACNKHGLPAGGCACAWLPWGRRTCNLVGSLRLCRQVQQDQPPIGYEQNIT